MHAQGVISTVDENGLVHVGTDQPKGTRVSGGVSGGVILDAEGLLS